MAKYIQDGDFLNYTPSGAAVTAGQPVLCGDRVFVAPNAIADGVLGALATEGVWEFGKTTGEAWAFGQKLYWVAGTSKASTTAGSNKVCGYAAAAAVSGATVGNVLLGQ